MEPVRLGILSAAWIADTVVATARHVEGVRVDAVASRSKERASSFAKRHRIRKTCGYDDLIADPEIDALYIPLPTTLAANWAVRAAFSGKHILVDKPFESETTVRAISDAADSAGVVFLDGTHFVHHARTAKVTDILREGRIGNVRGIVVSFTRPLNLPDIRKDPALEPLGAVGDLGWYCARAAVTFLGAERTAEIRDLACFGSMFEDVPEQICEANGIVRFADGATLAFDCGFKSVLRQRLEIVGEKGAVLMDDFVVPKRHYDKTSAPEGESADTEFELETERTDEHNRAQPSEKEVVTVTEPKSSKGAMLQSACMLHEFVKLIQGKDKEKQDFWKAQTMNTQRIVDNLRRDFMQRMTKKDETLQ